MDGESEAIRAMDRRIRMTQAALEEALRKSAFWQQQINRLSQTRRDLWRERRLQRLREAKAAEMATTQEVR